MIDLDLTELLEWLRRRGFRVGFVKDGTMLYISRGSRRQTFSPKRHDNFAAHVKSVGRWMMFEPLRDWLAKRGKLRTPT